MIVEVSRAASRRNVLRAAAIGALAPASAWATLATASTPRPTLSSAKSIVLTRRLTRYLSDGAQIVVVRVWNGTISPRPGGFVVDAHYASASVDAPAALSALAQIEQRRETRQFPLTLDLSGLIAPPQGLMSNPDQELGTSVEQAIGEMSLDAEKRAFMASFVADLKSQVSNSGAGFPPYLFFPHPGSASVSEAVALGNGLTGQIDVTVTARIHEDGLMQYLVRDMVTTIDGQRRKSLEEFSLAVV